jgi:hypothetical protein
VRRDEVAPGGPGGDAFADPARSDLQAAATEAGATLVAASNGLLDQLPALLERAWEME